jgi:methyl-accepting chemotaxis protein
MSQTITDISKNTSAVSDAYAEAGETAQGGKEIAAVAITKANSVYTTTVELASRVEKLTKRVGEIGNIVTVIKGIADQTNLLALNAAIEAARAGEQGRGFAVVADEVRKLAERTIKATADISEKIGAVQEESSQTAKYMSEASSQVTELKLFIKNVGGALEAIVGMVQQVSDQIARIAVAVEEQSSTTADVAQNIEKSAGIAKDMDSMADDMLHKIGSLTTIASNLRNITAGYKTNAGKLMILDLAKSDHLLFMDKIGSSLNNGTVLDPAQLPDHRSCRFGKWYFSEGMETCGTLPGFKAVDGPHAKIHAMAKEAVIASRAGDKEKATHIYREMEDVSGKIAELLDQIKKESGN